MARVAAARKAKMGKKPITTLIGAERNALTAGATIWNRSPDPKLNPSGAKFRPREEWVVKENTHKALITMAEAEALLVVAMPSGRRNRRGPSGRFLLSGLVFTPKGVPIVSSGDGYYRVAPKGQRVSAPLLEQVVLDHINQEMDADEFIAQFIDELKRAAAALATDPHALATDLKSIEQRIAGLLRLAEKVPDSSALVERLCKLEGERAEARNAIARSAENAAAAKALAATTTEQARRYLAGWKARPSDSIEERHAALAQIVERIEFDPARGKGRVHYRMRGREPGEFITPTGVKVASPRGREPRLSP